MTHPQDPNSPTPASRRARRSRIAAVGASLGAAVVLTGGLALADQGSASGGSSKATTGRTTQVAPATGNRDDDYRDDPYGDDGSYYDNGGGSYYDDGGGQWRDVG